MSVKVVQGLIGQQVQTPVNQSSIVNQQNNSTAAVMQQVTQAAAQTIASSEAVSVSVRSNRTISGGEKIKDYKQAREVTDSVAEKIRSEDGAKDAHSGLSSSSGANLV